MCQPSQWQPGILPLLLPGPVCSGGLGPPSHPEPEPWLDAYRALGTPQAQPQAAFGKLTVSSSHPASSSPGVPQFDIGAKAPPDPFGPVTMHQAATTLQFAAQPARHPNPGELISGPKVAADQLSKLPICKAEQFAVCKMLPAQSHAAEQPAATSLDLGLVEDAHCPTEVPAQR